MSVGIRDVKERQETSQTMRSLVQTPRLANLSHGPLVMKMHAPGCIYVMTSARRAGPGPTTGVIDKMVTPELQ